MTYKKDVSVSVIETKRLPCYQKLDSPVKNTHTLACIVTTLDLRSDQLPGDILYMPLNKKILQLIILVSILAIVLYLLPGGK